MVGFPQAWQVLNPINPSANPSLISLDDRTPKVIIVAKTAVPLGADHRNELPKLYFEPVAHKSNHYALCSLHKHRALFVVSNNTFSQ